MPKMQLDPAARAAALRARIDEAREEIRRGYEQEEELTKRIGALIAASAEPAAIDALRKQRREIRDRCEDLEAALPHIEREAEQAEKDAAGVALEVVSAELREREAVAASIGASLRERLRGIPALAQELQQLADEYMLPTGRARGLAERAGVGRPNAPGVLHAAGFDYAWPQLLAICAQIRQVIPSEEE